MANLPILPAPLLETLQAIGEALEEGKLIGDDVTAVISALGELDPRQLARAEPEIITAAALDRWRHAPSRLERVFLHRLIDADQLPLVAGLEYLFILHRDGRLREAALFKIRGPVPNAFLFVAIAWRLNDWVEPVRTAAARCARSVFPQTAPEVVANAALALLDRRATWKRWGPEQAVLDQAFARADVAEQLAIRFATQRTGPMGSLLRQCLSNDTMDAHLDRLAAEAAQPAVRACATQTLIEGEASWPSGWRWRWIDKSMGLRRRETAFARRPLKVSIGRADVIRRGLRDRAATVRFIALAGLLEHLDELPDAHALAERACGDSSPSVCTRAKFLLDRLSPANATG